MIRRHFQPHSAESHQLIQSLVNPKHWSRSHAPASSPKVSLPSKIWTVVGLHRALKEKMNQISLLNKVKLFELLTNTSREQTLANKKNTPSYTWPRNVPMRDVTMLSVIPPRLPVLLHNIPYSLFKPIPSHTTSTVVNGTGLPVSQNTVSSFQQPSPVSAGTGPSSHFHTLSTCSTTSLLYHRHCLPQPNA